MVPVTLHAFSVVFGGGLAAAILNIYISLSVSLSVSLCLSFFLSYHHHDGQEN